MPRLLLNIKDDILAAAREVLMEEGYDALSMRALAQACGIAVGTLYHYFSDKDDLVAQVTMGDWTACLAAMNAYAAEAHGLEEGLEELCRQLAAFTDRYRAVWRQYGSGGRVSGYTARFHPALRRQLAEPIGRFLAGAGRKDLSAVSDVLAETMLACVLNEDMGAAAFRRLAATWHQ